MPLFKYRYPNVANKEGFPLSETKLTEENPLYFYVDYVKPGRTIYMVQQH